ncbi:EamA family transporter [Halobacteria archaeon AArc-curdl1]|uniref:EamA family transporter n=1 Tax=Natronosalvus hydrolyticus TaxID=2979988 RepID=A0AAP3E4N0_9EURY|nr:EamA family transporter [Halobacteria archaeon AArc-curdl1]
MSQHAIAFAVLAMLGWGLWTVLANEATRTIAPELAMVLSYAASVVIAVGYVAAQGEPLALERTGVAYALGAGIFAGIGAVAFYTGLSMGRVGVVATISALYFVVAAIIGILVLGESLTLKNAAGIGFAILAVVLLAN